MVGKVLSTGFVSLLGELNSRSLVDGQIIPHEEYLRSFDTGNFAPIFPKDVLPSEFGGDGASAKVLANLVLMPPRDMARLETRTIVEVISDLYARRTPNDVALLKSQLLPVLGGKLFSGDVFGFLEMRSALIQGEMSKFTEDS